MINPYEIKILANFEKYKNIINIQMNLQLGSNDFVQKYNF
jgi:hypothetical protein